jgi:Peptidase A4 family
MLLLTLEGVTMKRVRSRVLLLISSAGMLVSAFSVGILGTAASAAGANPVITHAPYISVAPNAYGPSPNAYGPSPNARGPYGGVRNTWASSNWSGYAETGTYTGVTGTWTVPSVAATSSSTYSATWIGVDGFNDDDLIQTGTEQDYYGGAAHYDAWWEILPAAETEISPTSDPVSPGDRMSGAIYETSSTTTTTTSYGFFRRTTSEHVWAITISDTTKGWSFTTDQGYSGPGSSAEWVVEAPEVNGRIASLSHYTFSPPANTGDFDNAGYLKSIVSSGSPSYTAAGLNYQSDSGVLIQNGTQVSTPGDPDSALTAYNAAYGSSLPATPTG